jgi:mitotic spindle assembly checkpoint protein MAD2
LQITLRGSVEVVTEFFGYAINSILYQRGIYPPESFTSVAKYGLSVLVTSDEGLKSYLVQVLRQLAEWLTKGEVQKLVVVITGVESREVLERWVFNIDTDKTALAPGVTRVKSHKDIQGEIQAIIRQVTACVTFLPLLEEACSFDLLVYADTAAKVPAAWEESDPKVRRLPRAEWGWVVRGCEFPTNRP